VSFTYGANPSTSLLDAIRLLCGDTDPTQPLLQDEELNYITRNEPNQWFAAATAAQTIAARFARSTDRTVGKLSIKGTDQIKQYQQLAYDLRRRGATEGLTIINVSQSQFEKEQAVLDTDRTSPEFRRRLQDFPGVGIEEGQGGYFQQFEDPSA
jgi:hypothetical protein